MPQRTLRFRIRQDGLVEETVEGVNGNSCLQLTKTLEEELGVVERKELAAKAYLRDLPNDDLIPAEIF